ncbi:MAG: primosomal protein N' [Flavobacteriales bacterium]|nr:primosomal protein N' [Flavobacteriales bacterium]
MLPTYADIILPLAVPGTFTYELAVDDPDRVRPGMRVVVAFGRSRKLYSGLVLLTHGQAPMGHIPQPVQEILDEHPVATREQMALWQAISDHYLCTLGEVMTAALPAALMLSSSTRLVAATDGPPAWTGDSRQDLLLDALEQRHELSLEEAGKLIGLKNPMPVIKKLLNDGALIMAEALEPAWKPRMQQYVVLAPAAQGESALQGWFDALERAPKQLHLLMRYIELSRCFSSDPREVRREELLKRSDATAAELKRLCEKGVFAMEERLVGAVAGEAAAKPAPALSSAQRQALTDVRAAFTTKPIVLLHGVTSSGKTELYMELVQEVWAGGQQALYLLPEIALTTQIIGRLRARFGEHVAIFHSRLSPRERTDLWMQMLRDPGAHPIVVGARSALFLPFKDLGLVIVDEEHDPSYKQHDPAPRYNARDMAMVLAGLHGARTLLGSATPCMESLFNARNGKFGHASLRVRYGDAALPAIVKVDLAEMQKKRKMRGSFSEPLVAALQQTLARKEQAIIFRNRRGYAPAWQCDTCGWIPECAHCDVSLTYHKREHGLRCHYCGRGYTPPVCCSSCGSNRLRMVGLGTEKVEEELALLLPEARVARMDQDTTRGKHGLQGLLDRFGQGDIDILVGTQMVTKGLDFHQVTLVGILNADSLLRFPDLRAHERAFQLMAQVAGRSGRRRDPGTVYIQARDIHHPIIDLVARHDVDGMYARELPLRQAHHYPPFSRMVRIVLKHRDQDRVHESALVLADALRSALGDRVLGPEPPTVARVRDKYLRVLLLKLARNNYRVEKQFLRETIDRVFAAPPHRSVQLHVDVDPL